MKMRISMTLVFVAVALAWTPLASAQTNAEINAGIQFNFSTPGARSLGLGGAFLGLADDATAAYTNPAGLTMLSKPEVSMEVRQWNYTSSFTDHGHGYGVATGVGVDTVDGLQSGTADSDTTGLSFLSFVYPGDGWAVAVYRHELANFQTEYSTQGAFTGEDPSISRFFPTIADMDLKIVNTGASFAFRIGESFNLGLGVSYYSFDMTSTTSRYGFNSSGVSTDPGGQWGTPMYGDDRVINWQGQNGDDTDTAFNVGLTWNISPKVSLGGVYRQGPSFEVLATNNWGPYSGQPLTPPLKEVATTFNVPDVYGLGFAFRATDAFTIALDWTHVEYSALTADTTNLFGTSLDEATTMLTVDDGDEIHLGFEYVFINAKFPIALRFGGWSDPDHKIRFEGDPGDDAAMQTLAALFQPGDDEIHYTGGIGFIFGEKFQLDAAFDISEAIDTYSLSGVFRF